MRFLARLPFLRRRQGDFDEEVQSHLALEAERLVRQGMSPAMAQDEAKRAFGNVTVARERFFESRRALWLEHLGQDLRYTVRTVRRSPGFALTALITLAVGIGIDTALFSVLYSLALRPLPLRDSGTLVNVYQTFTGKWSREVRGSLNLVSYPEYERYRDRVTALDGLAAYAGSADFSLGGDEAEKVSGQLASCNYFQVLRVRVVLGRPFTSDDCRAVGESPVAIIGYGLWQRRFGSDSSIIGRVITVNQTRLTVIGVAEGGFGGTDLQPADAWFPVTLQPRLSHQDSIVTKMEASWLVAIGRMREGADARRAIAELSVVASQNDRLEPGRTTRVLVWPARLANEPEVRSRGSLIAIAVLAAATLVVLLICVNIMNLLLARASVRRREIAVRISLGAGRGRLIAQLLTESAVLSLVGGALGLVLAATVPSLLASSLVDSGVLQLDTSPNAGVFGYAFVLSCLAALAFGLVPALQATRLDLTHALRGESPSGALRRSGGRFRSVLVGVQVAGSALLLVVAALFLRSLTRAEGLDPGYATRGVAWVSLNLEDLGYDAARARALHALLKERLSAEPGVRGVADAVAIPLLSRWSTQVQLPDKSEKERVAATAGEDVGGLMVNQNIVSPNYLAVMGIPIVRGRTFTDVDASAGETPVVVSDAFARILQRNGEALGSRFGNKDARYVVMGVARDAQNSSLASVDGPFMYAAAPPDQRLAQRLVVRYDGSAATIARLAEEVARRFDPALVVRTEPYELILARMLRPARATTLLASAFGLLAMLLALVGIYGTVSYSVSQRTREIGVRVALGARPRDVTGLVVRQGLRVVFVGLAAGAVVGIGAAQALRAALFGLSPLDPIAFAIMASLIIVSSLLAVWQPARRAARVEPMAALRAD